jgi:cell division FtsZ-interacting protein ZapD
LSPPKKPHEHAKRAILAVAEHEAHLVMRLLRNTKWVRNRAAAEGLLQMEKEPGQAIIIINILLKAAEVYSKIMAKGR